MCKKHIVKHIHSFFVEWLRDCRLIVPIYSNCRKSWMIINQCCHFWRYIAKSAILGFSLAMENLSWRYIANRQNSAILSLKDWRNRRNLKNSGDFGNIGSLADENQHILRVNFEKFVRKVWKEKLSFKSMLFSWPYDPVKEH